ncbi:AsmA family protein [Jinshanibacter sp. LJY008]|uniref:AsmA family protein n=1 Tax=Limnobaculum eriocheiris TaxID=2897391 RepID=A0A9X1MX43_9GAMM|nr:AsmA family protein [Limnobaculum eriocheiris]MCD1126504.1 AsmA family protein [Limnobaculum eriocheiris]
MRFIRKSLYTLLTLILVLAIVVYFIAQTSYAARWISQWVTDNTPYQLSLDHLDYSITSPYQLVLNDVEFSQQKQSPLLKAKKVTLELTSSFWQTPMYFSALELEDGTLNLSSKNTIALAPGSDRFQLKNMTLNVDGPELTLQGEKVNGGIIPWTLTNNFLPEKDNRFEFSADKLVVNGIDTHKILVQGEVKDHQILFNNVGADLANGQLTGNGKRTADGKWQIESLRLSEVKYQSQLELDQLLAQLNQRISNTDISLNRLDLINTNIQGPEWAFSDFTLSMKDLEFIKGRWQATSGSMLMNASDMIYNDNHLVNPVLSLDLENNSVKIKQFSSRWQDGLVRATGNWQRDTQTLTLDEVAFTALLYTLPKEWLTQLKQVQPEWLRELHVVKLAANRNILIDITPDFPFQFTSIDSNGSNLYLVKNRQVGLWGGTLNFNASDATLNKIDLRHPSFNLNATPETITISEISAFTKEGLIEANATLSQQPERALSLTLNGRSVPVDILQSWGWQAIPLQGNGTIALQLHGDLIDKQSGKPELKGSLKMTSDTGQQLTQYPAGQKDIPEQPQAITPAPTIDPPVAPIPEQDTPEASPFG